MGYRVTQLAPGDPPDAFPDPADTGIALGYPDGLVAIGGDLSVPRLLAAYQRGIFPWYNDAEPILWWSPDPRAVLLPANFHMSRSLRRELRRGHWAYSLNQRFAAVIRNCASNRGPHGTWITPDIAAAFTAMHAAGYAHSLESWHDGELAGGVYGIRLGRVFFAESMYSGRTSGSKVALSALVWLARQQGIELIDCQLESPHLRSLGMQTLERSEFLRLLPDLTDDCTPLPNWQFGLQPATALTTLRSPAAC